MAKKNLEETAEKILRLIGGPENVSIFTHCVTRLRFTVKDMGLVQSDAIGRTPGVIGTQWLGEQFQVIIGSDVDQVYRKICQIGGLAEAEAIQENLDGHLGGKKPFSPRHIWNSILAYISPAMNGIIPLMMAACMCKTILALFGPELLGILPADSDLYILLDFMYDAFFYFMPMFLGYSAAKALNMNPLFGIYLGCLIMAPDFMAMIGVRESFSVFGIPVPVASYAQSFLPVILGVWILSYLMRLLNRLIPSVLKAVFVPLFAILIMAPVMFALCAPLGTYIGNVIGGWFIALSQSILILRIFGAVLLAVLLPYMVLSGMHGALVNFAIMTFVANGSETFILPIMLAYNFAVFGVTLGAGIRLKRPENKTAVAGYFVSGILGSVTEPCLYGVILKYRQSMKALMLTSVVVGLIAGIFSPTYYVITSATAFTFWIPWVAGGTGNLIAGIVLMLGALLVGTVTACFVGYPEETAA